MKVDAGRTVSSEGGDDMELCRICVEDEHGGASSVGLVQAVLGAAGRREWRGR